MRPAPRPGAMNAQGPDGAFPPHGILCFSHMLLRPGRYSDL